MNDGDREKLIRRSDQLDRRLTATPVEEAVQSLIRYGKRNRVMIWILAASVLLDVLLSVGLGVVALEARNATSTAHQNANNIQTACVASNRSRQDEVKLWHGLVVEFKPPAGETPEARMARLQQSKDFLRLIDKTFASRDCNQRNPFAGG